MLHKQKDTMIDCREKASEALQTAVPINKKESPRGPTIYLSNVDLPLTDKDLNETIMIKAKIIPRQISTSTTNGKTRKSFDLELTGISFSA